MASETLMVSNSLALCQSQEGEGDAWSGSVLGMGMTRSRAQTRLSGCPSPPLLTEHPTLPFLPPASFSPSLSSLPSGEISCEAHGGPGGAACLKHERLKLGPFSVENIRETLAKSLPISGPCLLFPILLSIKEGLIRGSWKTTLTMKV